MGAIFKDIDPSVLVYWKNRVIPAGQTPPSPNQGMDICPFSNLIHGDNVMKAVKSLGGWIGD
jgi:hypothetical protein